MPLPPGMSVLGPVTVFRRQDGSWTQRWSEATWGIAPGMCSCAVAAAGSGTVIMTRSSPGSCVTLTAPGIMAPRICALWNATASRWLRSQHRGRLGTSQLSGGLRYIELYWGQVPKAWIGCRATTSATSQDACRRVGAATLRRASSSGAPRRPFPAGTGAVTERLDLADTHVTWRCRPAAADIPSPGCRGLACRGWCCTPDVQ